MSAKLGRALPWVLLAILLLPAVFLLRSPRTADGIALHALGAQPALAGGRVKPLDTIARTSLLMLRGNQTLRTEGARLSAMEWLLDMLFHSRVADGYRVFEIDDPDVLGLLGIAQDDRRTFSFEELRGKLVAIDTQAAQAEQLKPEQRDRFQRAIVTLRQRLVLYQKLQNTVQLAGETETGQRHRRYVEELVPLYLAHAEPGKARLRNVKPESMMELAREAEKFRFLEQAAEFFPLPEPAAETGGWWPIGRGYLEALTQPPHPGLERFARLGDGWRARDKAAILQAVPPVNSVKVQAEWWFNRLAPFYQSLVLYAGAALLIFISRLVWQAPLQRSAYLLMAAAFLIHTLGLAARMWFQGRPPVTNLYSSAIFVGWISVLIGLGLERLYRNGLATLSSSAIGFVTLIIAHHLAMQGDTLEMMRAVLDSNFWLATHVVTITVGYGATFVAGFLGAVYLIRRLWDRRWTEADAQTLDRMAYGVVCFSLLFSFVGTILGGIWADQSWGRFWGWDPKENGALMIVLWNAFILHARVGQFAKRDAVMALAVFGNIVTAFSWFGVNMLGIGLHSYGFMDKAFAWLVGFVTIHLVVVSLVWWRPRHPAPHR